MKRKILASVIIAVAMGTATPLNAESSQLMYHYFHYENGVIVGEAEDRCYSYGVATVWLYGYGTNEVVPVLTAQCVDGQVVPLD